jgi:hypothetical protein
MEPKRCSACGVIATCEGVTCPSCHQLRLRALTAEELRAWQRHEDLDEETRARCVAVQCGLT